MLEWLMASTSENPSNQISYGTVQGIHTPTKLCELLKRGMITSLLMINLYPTTTSIRVTPQSYGYFPNSQQPSYQRSSYPSRSWFNTTFYGSVPQFQRFLGISFQLVSIELFGVTTSKVWVPPICPIVLFCTLSFNQTPVSSSVLPTFQQPGSPYLCNNHLSACT